MRLRSIANLLMLAGVTLLFAACGGGGGGGGSTATPVDPNAAATVTVTASKAQALAGTDLVTITANVTKNAGGAIADGTVVAFTTTSGVLNSATTTTGGVATVILSHAALGTGILGDTSTVTATVGGVAGSTAVKFITQPDGAKVYLTITPPLVAANNIIGIQMDVNRNGSGSFQSVFPINDLQGKVFGAFLNTDGSLIATESGTSVIVGTTTGNFTAGITTTANVPIFLLNYGAITSGLPTFTTSNVSLIDNALTVTNLSSTNIIVSVDYYKGVTKL